CATSIRAMSWSSFCERVNLSFRRRSPPCIRADPLTSYPSEWVRSVVTSIAGVSSSAVFCDAPGRGGPCHPCRTEVKLNEPQDAFVAEARGLLCLLLLCGPTVSVEAEDSRRIDGVSGLTRCGFAACRREVSSDGRWEG